MVDAGALGNCNGAIEDQTKIRRQAGAAQAAKNVAPPRRRARRQ
jgi:hypothetical protein